jgi:mannose-6-phosphate isomerase-like protein (cupin superfamily)
MTSSAMFLEPGEGRTFPVGADRATAKVEADATGDAFALAEYEAAPGVPGPPLHVHRIITETFYILDGEVEFRSGGKTQKLGRGSLAFVPPGVEHTFANNGGAVARWIGIFTPGRYIALIEEIGKAFPAGGGAPDEAVLMKAFADWDTEVVPE